MILHRVFLILTVVSLLRPSIVLSAGGTEEAARSRRPATILYQLKADASSRSRMALKKILERYAFQVVRTIGNGRTVRARATANQFPREEWMADDLMETGAVEFAEPDYSLPLALLRDHASWQANPVRNHYPEAESVEKGAEVTIGLCDTGVEADHPALAGNILLPGHNVVNGGSDTDPVHAHGTMMAGYLAGAAKSSRILPVRVTSSSNGRAYVSDLAECVRWSAEQGARVVSMSYPAGSSSSIEAAARFLREKGGLLFVAAGNEGLEVRAPFTDAENIRSFVVVGATGDSDLLRARWSNYGESIHLMAPGESINTTLPGGQFGSGSGTSVATAVAAGGAALLFSVNSSFRPDQVESFLFSSAVAQGLGRDRIYGHGRMSLRPAMQQARHSTQNPAVRQLASTTGREESGN